MNRKQKRLLYRKMARLMVELDKNTELFFAERPWLSNMSLEPEFKDRTDYDIEEEVTNKYAIELLIRNIQETLYMRVVAH